MAPELRREQLIDAALEVILAHGYSGVSIEAIARMAGVTRPVVYDHFANLGLLLQALVEREERYAVEQLERVVPGDPQTAGRHPAELLSGGVRRFLDAVASRPTTWRIILLPPEGTPEIVRTHVERQRARILERVAQLVRWALTRPGLPRDLDVDLAARAIREFGEQAGRMVLTDAKRYSPERYERFVESVVAIVWPPDARAD